MTIADIKKTTEAKMDQSIAAFKNNLAKIRTGRANPQLLDTIHVEYYGSMVPLSQQLPGPLSSNLWKVSNDRIVVATPAGSAIDGETSPRSLVVSLLTMPQTVVVRPVATGGVICAHPAAPLPSVVQPFAPAWKSSW